MRFRDTHRRLITRLALSSSPVFAILSVVWTVYLYFWEVITCLFESTKRLQRVATGKCPIHEVLVKPFSTKEKRRLATHLIDFLPSVPKRFIFLLVKFFDNWSDLFFVIENNSLFLHQIVVLSDKKKTSHDENTFTSAKQKHKMLQSFSG